MCVFLCSFDSDTKIIVLWCCTYAIISHPFRLLWHSDKCRRAVTQFVDNTVLTCITHCHKVILFSDSIVPLQLLLPITSSMHKRVCSFIFVYVRVSEAQVWTVLSVPLSFIFLFLSS